MLRLAIVPASSWLSRLSSDPGSVAVHAEDRLGQRRLPGSGLADQSQRLAVGQRQVDADQRRNLVALLPECLRYAVDQEDLGTLGGGASDRARYRLERRDLVVMVAPGQVPVGYLDQFGRHLATYIGDQRAAVDEHACRQLRAERRKRARDGRQSMLRLAHPATRNRMQQTHRVWMLR